MPKDGSTITPEKTLAIQFPGDLRDYFAGQALAGGAEYGSHFDGMNPPAIASRCYRIADAMLLERNKPTTKEG